MVNDAVPISSPRPVPPGVEQSGVVVTCANCGTPQELPKVSARSVWLNWGCGVCGLRTNMKVTPAMRRSE